jgi:CheY-like chemotaxis protein
MVHGRAGGSPMHAPEGLSVLVVDDYPDAAESLADLLGMYGHRVTVAHTAREALEVADRERPDVVLLDIRLPDMDGWQVARWMREQASVRDRRPLLLVAVTGCCRDEDCRRSVAAGIDFHLIKPVDPDLLVRVLMSYPRADDRELRADGSSADRGPFALPSGGLGLRSSHQLPSLG